MLRRLLAFLVFGMSVTSITAVAVAQDEPDESPSDQSTPEAKEPAPEAPPPTAAPQPAKATLAPPPAAEVKVEAKSETKSEGLLAGWKTEVHGYFRAPMTLGLSSRPDPNEFDVTGKTKNGTSRLQISYGPNRVMDWSYYSFAYTGLQEQDWAELFIHEKKKHVDAVVGWMGYWFGAAGYRNPDAAWLPGMAYVTLDSDFEIAGITPNVALTMGSFWPQFGYVEKYDTFTLGRFRMLGEQATLTVPFTQDLTMKLYQGFGTNRDGAYNFSMNNTSPLYAGKTGADLMVYGHLQVAYQQLLNVGLHINYEFTRDPRLAGEKSVSDGEGYNTARAAHIMVAGGEVTVRAPYLGRLWISPSYISVKNGFELAGAGGLEVMHAQTGYGLAENYLGWTGTPAHSTGSGTMLNLGFLYENWLSNLLPDWGMPEFKLSVFGLLTKATFDLPDIDGKTPLAISQKGLTQIKYGADLTAQVTNWFAAMLRWDTVLYNQSPQMRSIEDFAKGWNQSVDEFKKSNNEGGHIEDYNELKKTTFGGYVFSALTARLSLFSHYLSGECIFLQYSRYFYGDRMVLAGTWPWNTAMVAGSTVVQATGYSKAKPDENVIKLQAQVKF